MLLTAVSFAGIFSVWAAILQFQLRHAGLTALVLLAPLPFVCVAAMPAAFADAHALLSYVLGIAIAQTIGVRIARGVCDGLVSSAAVSQAIREEVKAAGPIGLGFAVWIIAADLHPFNIENLTGTAAMFAVLIGVPIVTLFARWLPYSEQFIARANQARERRERVLEHLLFIAETRWAFSITGVALIFFALSALGMRALQLESGVPLPERLTELAVIVFASAIFLTRNWRLSLALTLTISLLVAIGLWIFARGALPLQRQTLLAMSILLATAAVPMTIVAAAINRHIRDGDDIALALARGYQNECANAVLSAAIFVSPWIVLGVTGGMRLELAISIASLLAAPLIFPALVGAIYALIPRYRTVDEVFGKR